MNKVERVGEFRILIEPKVLAVLFPEVFGLCKGLQVGR